MIFDLSDDELRDICVALYVYSNQSYMKCHRDRYDALIDKFERQLEMNPFETVSKPEFPQRY